MYDNVLMYSTEGAKTSRYRMMLLPADCLLVVQYLVFAQRCAKVFHNLQYNPL